MATTLHAPLKSGRKNAADESAPLLLKTRQEAREYLAKHLKPVGHGPKGQPLYAKKDIDSLNIILPEDS
jgi:hypothetical protein